MGSSYSNNKRGAIMSSRVPFKSILLNLALLTVSVTCLSVTGLAHAAGFNNECPVGLVTGKTLDEEFGTGTSDLTNCISRRNNVKLLIQINQYCGNSSCTRAYALHNIYNVIADYETTYGMRPGKDYEIAAIVHSGGGPLVIKNGTTGDGVHFVTNAFEGQVQDLMNKGVKFYFCMNTTRGMQGSGSLPADATSALVTSVDADGVEHSVGYVTAGITALADFQQRGYEYVQP
jgi:intracellular sulfur oxidation DsrE/DsrF family protein